MPYTPGMVITAIGQARAGRDLSRLKGPRIQPNANGVLPLMFGPRWVG